MEERLLRSAETTPSPGPGPSPTPSPAPPSPPVPTFSATQHPIPYTGLSRPSSQLYDSHVEGEATTSGSAEASDVMRSLSVVTILRDERGVLARHDDEREQRRASSETGSRTTIYASTRSLLHDWTPPNTPINTQNIVFNLPSQIWTNENVNRSEFQDLEQEPNPHLVEVVTSSDSPQLESNSVDVHKRQHSGGKNDSYATSIFKEIRSMFTSASPSLEGQDNLASTSCESVATNMGSSDTLVAGHRRSSSAHAGASYARSPHVWGEPSGTVGGEVHTGRPTLPRTLSEPVGRPFYTTASWSPFLEKEHRANTGVGCRSGGCSSGGVGVRSWSSSRQSSFDDPVCRICWTAEPGGQPLILPCYCSAHVHEDCLRKWLTVAKASSCEVCRYAFPSTQRIKPLRQWKWRMGKSRHFAQFEATLMLLCIVTPPLLCGIILCSKKVGEFIDGTDMVWKSTGLMSLVLLSVFTYIVALVYFIRKLRTVCRQLIDNNRTSVITIVPLSYTERYAWKEQGVPSPDIPIRNTLRPVEQPAIPPPPPEERLHGGQQSHLWRRQADDLDGPTTSGGGTTQEIWTIST